MIKLEIKWDPASEKYITNLPHLFEKGLTKGLKNAVLFAEGAAKKVFAEGGPVKPKILTARTGHLRRSIKSGTSSPISGWIGTKVKYGIIHELIGAGKAKVLRPFLAPAFEGENLNKIREIIFNSVVKETK